VIFICRKILRHGADGFTSPPKEGVLRIVIARNNPALRPGLNPRALGSVANTLIVTPPWLLSYTEPVMGVPSFRTRFFIKQNGVNNWTGSTRMTEHTFWRACGDVTLTRSEPYLLRPEMTQKAVSQLTYVLVCAAVSSFAPLGCTEIIFSVSLFIAGFRTAIRLQIWSELLI
jgi:hypothetical protein